MTQVFLSLGSNLGDRIQHLQTAMRLIELYAGNLLKCSSFYESEPWGFETDQWFINCAIEIETELEPMELLDELQKIEKQLGRTREEGKMNSRTIDIDILFFNCQLSTFNFQLEIPHPRMHLRKFVLVPLMEITKDAILLGFNKTAEQLLSECLDISSIKRFDV